MSPQIDSGGGSNGGSGTNTDEETKKTPQNRQAATADISDTERETGGLTNRESTGSTNGRGKETAEPRVSAPDTRSQERQQLVERGKEARTGVEKPQARMQATQRANQSVSFSTTGVGTTGTPQSRARNRTRRANQSPSFSTRTLGTTGTSRTRQRRRTPRANQSASLSTTTVGTDLTATAEAERRRSEEFGDYTLTLGGQTDDARTRIGTRLATNEANPAAPETNTGAVTFEAAARDLSQSYRSRVSESFESGALSDPITDDVVGVFASEDTADRAGETVSTTAEAAVQSVNPFQAAIGIKEVTEFGAEAVKETAEGDLGVNATVTPTGVTFETTDDGFAPRAGRRAGQVAGAAIAEAQENPVEAGAMLTGSLLGTGAVLGAASRTGRVSSAAARYSIQPGEEIAGTLGYRATRAATSARTAERLFPDGEVLISEEGAIRAARGARSRLSGLRPNEFTARPTPRQAELVRRFGPGAGGRGTLDEFGVPERARSTVPPQSELGSDTESILDATTSVDIDAGRSTTTTTRTESESDLAAESDQGQSESPPLFSEIREAGGVRPYIRNEDLPGAGPILTSEIESFRELVGDDRAQGSLLGRSRSRQRSPETSEFDEARVGGELRRRQLSQRRQLSGDFDGEIEPFRTRTFEAERPRERTSTEAESEVSTRSPAETYFPQEDAVAQEEGLAPQQTRIGAGDVDVEGVPARVGIGARPGNAADVQTDTRVRPEQAQEFDTDFESEFQLLAAQISQAEQESEIEAESEFDTRTRIRAERRDTERDDEAGEFSVGFGAGGGRGAADVLVPGWLEETATDIATRGFSGQIAPSQAALASEATVERASGSLPTRQFFDDGETREQVQQAQSFLTFGTVGEPDDAAEPFFGGES